MKFCDNISHKFLRPSQFLEKIIKIIISSWKKFWNVPLYRNKPDSSLLINVAGCWKRSNTKACMKKLSQILANNIDNGVRVVGLTIYVRYCRSVPKPC